MAPELIGVLGVGVLLVFILAGVPVAFSFIVVGSLGIWYLTSFSVVLSSLMTIPYRWVVNYELAPVVLFIVMAAFVSQSGIARVLYTAANSWMGRLRGGVAIATVFACGMYATVCGSSVASAAAMSSVALPEMKKLNYHDRLAAGSIAAGGTIGILIPPSISFIVYGVLVEQSIGKLFIAGIIPGILEILGYACAIILTVKLYPSLAPVGTSFSFKEKIYSLKPVWPLMFLSVFILWGIYGGVFTPTEAGGIGAVAAFFILLAARRMTGKTALASMREGGSLSCAIFFIIIGAMVFNRFLALSGLTSFASEVAGKIQSPTLFIIYMMIIYLILGCFMEALSMIVLTVPILLPMLDALNINLIWYGVLLVRMIEVGMITPPVGLNIYTIRAANPDVATADIIIGIIPFFIMDIIIVALLIYFPMISLYLPSAMK